LSMSSTLVLAIAREKSLHEPMYIFILFLSVNSLYGTAGFFFRFLRDLLSDSHLISRPACFTQIYVIYTYASYELTLLGIMHMIGMVAICQPLHYHNKITARTICKLFVIAWIYPPLAVGTCVYLSSRLPLCDNKIPKVFCANWNIVKLSCVSTVLNNLVGMLVSTTIILSLEFVVIPPILNPLVYGLKLPEIRKIMLRMFKTCPSS
ncbi:olfactory receptor 1361-like, partial [Acanthochromis polyacanthus]|uniref:olfactory receptor 1361-like n=1 Tax=Acanthochromis polyacanthus TaxID=80966 RepID=UPI0022343FD6